MLSVESSRGLAVAKISHKQKVQASTSELSSKLKTGHDNRSKLQ